MINGLFLLPLYANDLVHPGNSKENDHCLSLVDNTLNLLYFFY